MVPGKGAGGMGASCSPDSCRALQLSWRAVPDHSMLSGLHMLLTKPVGVTLEGKPCLRHSAGENFFPWKSSLCNDGLKRPGGTEAPLLPGLSSECSWALGDSTRGQMWRNHGGVTLSNHSKGAMKQVGAEHRLGECMSSVKH